jgi:hypothetical protein
MYTAPHGKGVAHAILSMLQGRRDVVLRRAQLCRKCGAQRVLGGGREGGMSTLSILRGAKATAGDERRDSKSVTHEAGTVIIPLAVVKGGEKADTCAKL